MRRNEARAAGAAPPAEAAGRALVVELSRAPHGTLWAAREPSGALVDVRRFELAAAGATASRIEAAARSAIGLRREGLVAIVGVERVERELRIASEHVDGTLLWPLLRLLDARGAAMPAAVAVRVALDLLDALSSLRGTCYRPGGLAAGSVLVGLDGRARLLEAPLAAVLLGHPPWARHRDVLGYRAPELLERGAPADLRADVFTVGVFLWEMLRAERLFGAFGPAALEAMVCACRVPPLDHPGGARRLEVPRPLAEVVDLALLADPAARLSSPAAFARALVGAAERVAHPGELAALVRRQLADAPRVRRVRSLIGRPAQRAAGRSRANRATRPAAAAEPAPARRTISGVQPVLALPDEVHAPVRPNAPARAVASRRQAASGVRPTLRPAPPEAPISACRDEPAAPSAVRVPRPQRQLPPPAVPFPRGGARALRPPSPRSARRTVGCCELLGEIARGGMATVHLGRWRGASGFTKTVAIKALHAQYARDPDFVRMLLDEARMVARIRHPNVTPTIDLVDEHGELFIVMEYVEGVTLACLQQQLAERGAHMPRPVALAIVAGVLHGLHAAHQATGAGGAPLGLIHRDVSPENILVGIDGFARLIDFGIAKALGRYTHTREGQVKGKLGYLAPEQLTGEPVDRRTDVYSTSVVLWQALTGCRLHRGKNLAELAYSIMRRPAPPPSALRPSVPRDLDRLVMHGLARSLAKRWRTAEAMAVAIERIGPLASHAQVGAWVKAVAPGQLAERAALLVAGERRSSLPPALGGGLASRAPSALAKQSSSMCELPVGGAVSGDVGDGAVRPGVRRPPARLLVAAAVGVAMLLVVLLAALWRVQHRVGAVGPPSTLAPVPIAALPTVATAAGGRSVAGAAESSGAPTASMHAGSAAASVPSGGGALPHTGHAPWRPRRVRRPSGHDFVPTDI